VANTVRAAAPRGQVERSIKHTETSPPRKYHAVMTYAEVGGIVFGESALGHPLPTPPTPLPLFFDV